MVEILSIICVLLNIRFSFLLPHLLHSERAPCMPPTPPLLRRVDLEPNWKNDVVNFASCFPEQRMWTSSNLWFISVVLRGCYNKNISPHRKGTQRKQIVPEHRKLFLRELHWYLGYAERKHCNRTGMLFAYNLMYDFYIF